MASRYVVTMLLIILCPHPYNEESASFTDSVASESTAKVIEMNDDSPEGIDMYLLYLYTLQPPELSATNPALHALVIGGKYNAPILRDAGKIYTTNMVLRASAPISTTQDRTDTEAWLRHIKCYWSQKMPIADDIKTALVESVFLISPYLIGLADFQGLLLEHSDLNIALIKEFLRQQQHVWDKRARAAQLLERHNRRERVMG
ncbi:hypothetical protein LTS08_007850 [Lithohypha guttulata]|nr:hypothetical protein LTS08_007850 [Lithohypha guttulata]